MDDSADPDQWPWPMTEDEKAKLAQGMPFYARRTGWRRWIWTQWIWTLYATYALPYCRRLLRRAGGLLNTRRLIWLAALALIAAGVLCLSLSGQVATPLSWWQSTWQALGVGFVVGGMVDVLALSFMNLRFNSWSAPSAPSWNDQAASLIRDRESLVRDANETPWDPSSEAGLHALHAYNQLSLKADWLLREHGHEISRFQRRQLRMFAVRRD